MFSLLQIVLFLIVLLLCVKPLGTYIANIFDGKTRFLYPIENILYHYCNINAAQEMNWKKYLAAMLIFNFFGMLMVYVILRLQSYLPFNPQQFSSLDPDLAFNIAASFATNTDWETYSGELTISYISQMFALTVQNFLSAATGLALLMALIRGIVRHGTTGLGNFWVDMTRGTLYLLLPLAVLLAVFLSSQGVIQNLNAFEKARVLQPFTYPLLTTINENKIITENITLQEQIIPMGPVASQVAIKQLGSNGGGFFNTNSAHPFENPNPLTNFFEMLAILLIPAALCYSFGLMIKDKRQGWSIFIAILIIFIPAVFFTNYIEQKGNPAFNLLGVSQTALETSPGGNMEGKETRFGIVNSAMWATATTASSNGAVNSMHDSFTPLGGFVILWLMHLGEIIFGGIGSGLASMIVVIIITVFMAGLMVGRTPEYLGKKIEPFEMKMASLAILIMPLIALLFTSIAVVTNAGTFALGNLGPHGFTEILYAFTSLANHNGSAFAGLHTNSFFYNVLGAFAMLVGRYWIAIPILAIAGSLAKKNIIPTSTGTLPTHTPLFIVFLVTVILILGALTFFPALVLGPVVEHLILWKQYV